MVHKASQHRSLTVCQCKFVCWMAPAVRCSLHSQAAHCTLALQLHLFDGLAFLTKIKVSQGRVWASQRYLNSEQYRCAKPLCWKVEMC